MSNHKTTASVSINIDLMFVYLGVVLFAISAIQRGPDATALTGLSLFVGGLGSAAISNIRQRFDSDK